MTWQKRRRVHGRLGAHGSPGWRPSELLAQSPKESCVLKISPQGKRDSFGVRKEEFISSESAMTSDESNQREKTKGHGVLRT